MANNDVDKSRFTLDRVIWLCTMVGLFFIQQNRLESKWSQLFADLVTKQQVMETRLTSIEQADKDMAEDQKEVQAQLTFLTARLPDEPTYQSYSHSRPRR